MKRLGLVLVGAALVAGMVSCSSGDILEEGVSYDCSDNGRIYVFNSSLSTTQEFLVDGRSIAVLPPGENNWMQVDLGTHTVQLRGISGGRGCAPLTVDIEPCDQELIECKY